MKQKQLHHYCCYFLPALSHLTASIFNLLSLRPTARPRKNLENFRQTFAALMHTHANPPTRTRPLIRGNSDSRAWWIFAPFPLDRVSAGRRVPPSPAGPALGVAAQSRRRTAPPPPARVWWMFAPLSGGQRLRRARVVSSPAHYTRPHRRPRHAPPFAGRAGAGGGRAWPARTRGGVECSRVVAFPSGARFSVPLPAPPKIKLGRLCRSVSPPSKFAPL